MQRRLGLCRAGSLEEYARHLRQSTAEVTALADDLLIHVTGFFRDPEAWEALRVKVVVPLVESRAKGATVRAWVAACSSGEEAYSLAMLLVEEGERRGNPLDVKVFATDLAERTLAHARGGLYPGGIESEVSPQRLERFFIREAEMYRVRADLRDRVVFAPQNILQDPPFSRLDIATCRNMLIYLEPEIQNRVLALLHFGLREGGALFLGSSETASGIEERFESIDKKHRIFRRVGPTRHGEIEFAAPHRVALAQDAPPQGVPIPSRPRRAESQPGSIAELSRQVLLDAHTPPAVTVDRDGHVVYFHGDAGPYLMMSGAPTQDLMLLAREGMRGAVRIALHRAVSENARVTVSDAWFDQGPGRRTRVTVTASPIANPANEGQPGEYIVVSFNDQEDARGNEAEGASNGVNGTQSEVRRLRAELQGTIEELQTSNEELKASHEEAMSVNEELQSANEELESSKEEMQSLNEELSTVNAQLRTKMEEHQAASNDLTSLLTSTDLAVLFLDTTLHIRRYTPAACELVDLIPGDVGRPLAALARKFSDPDLDADAKSALDRLRFAEREVAGKGGRHFLRRVTPYRTTDNRIDGVVVTFVDVTHRKRAEDALQASEEQFRRAIHDAPIPVVMQAEDGQVLQISRTWTELTGYSLADLPTADSWLTRAYGPGVEAVRAHMQKLFQEGSKSLNVEFAIRPRKGGERHWSFNASAPGVLQDGRRFLVGMAVDVTDRKHAEEALRASEERLRRALTAARMGIWTLDLQTGAQLRDANLNVLLGLDAAETTQPFDEFLTHIHGDDRAGVRTAFAASTREGRPLRVEFRVVRPDGVVRWLRDQGDVLSAAADDRGHMAGACVDVTERREAEEALKASEERLRLTLESATDFAILTLAPDRTVTSWSPGAAAAFGHTADQIVGQSADVMFTPEDQAAGVPEREMEEAVRSGRAADERWHVRRNGTRFYASGVMRPLHNGRGFVKVARDLTDRKRIEDELRDARDRLEERVAERTADLEKAKNALEAEMGRRRVLAQQLSTAQEDERRRLSRDLHDSVSQLMAGLSLTCKAIQASGDLPSLTVSRLVEAQGIINELGRELHGLAVRLRPTSLDDLGLESALEQLVSEWSTRTGVSADFHFSGIDVGRLPAEINTAIYRLVQELLTNIAKHANATAVGVVVTRLDGHISIVVEDDGSGFDPKETPKGRLGLLGMRERVEQVGGTIEIESSRGSGTTVIAQIPLPRDSESPS